MIKIFKYKRLYFLFYIVFFFACDHKDFRPKQDCRIIKRIKNGKLEAEYQYNFKRQISTIHYEGYYVNYIYGNYSIDIQAFFNDEHPYYSLHYLLNTNELAEYSTYLQIDSEGHGIQDSSFYSYNNEGYLTKEVIKHYQVQDHIAQLKDSSLIEYTIQSGNRIRSVEKTKDQEIITIYEYTNLEYKSNLETEPFKGKANRNLIGKLVYNNPFTGNYTTTYQYQLNAIGYPTLIKAVSSQFDNDYRLEYDCR